MWTGLWIAWNFYIICLHLEVGSLKLTEHLWTVNLLNDAEAPSWFKRHPFACAKAINYTMVDDVTMTSHEFCWSDYRLIEIYISSFQLLLAVFGLAFSLGTIKEIISHEDNSSVLSMQYVNSLERDRKRKIVHDAAHEQPLVSGGDVTTV